MNSKSSVKSIYALSAALFVLGIGLLSFTPQESQIDKTIGVYRYIVHTLSEHFVDEIDAEELQYNALHAMLNSLDPHSHFYDREETEERTRAWDGILREGIGVNILYRGGYTIIISVNQGSNAEAADLRAGDVILEVDGEEIYEAFTNDVAEKVGGEPGTEVNLKIERPGIGQFEKKVMRGNVPNIAVPFAGMVNPEIAYIKMNHFYGNSADTVRQFAEKFTEENPDLKGLIFDLRGNNGGGVIQATDIASLFLPNESVVFYQKPRNEGFVPYKTEKDPLIPDLPVVVLIDKHTISAPELVTGALQDNDRAVVLGQPSFGKGLVQQTWNTGDSTSMFFTISRYYTPLKRCIQKLDYEDYYVDFSNKIQTPSEYKPEKKNWFTTPNGRQFFDYSGIVPDITLDEEAQDPYLQGLAVSYPIFDFANNYRNTHKTIPSARQFELEDNYYALFLKFMEKEKYDFDIPGQAKLVEMENLLKDSGMSTNLEKSFEQFKAALKKEKQTVLIDKKPKVKEMLTDLILYRYYNVTGQCEYALDNDNEIIEAIEILKDTKRYNTLLGKK